jgi:hypothetical protein
MRVTLIKPAHNCLMNAVAPSAILLQFSFQKMHFPNLLFQVCAWKGLAAVGADLGGSNKNPSKASEKLRRRPLHSTDHRSKET